MHYILCAEGLIAEWISLLTEAYLATVVMFFLKLKSRVKSNFSV